MFRCHGNISGRAITNALHDMCSKILEEKKKAQESSRKTSIQKPWSDIINTPPPSSARGMQIKKCTFQLFCNDVSIRSKLIMVVVNAKISHNFVCIIHGKSSIVICLMSIRCHLSFSLALIILSGP